MPTIIQWISAIVPARYLIPSLQTVFLAGDIWPLFLKNIAILLLAGAVFLAAALAAWAEPILAGAVFAGLAGAFAAGFLAGTFFGGAFFADAFLTGAAFFVDGAGQRTLRLAFSAVAAARIDEGVRRLAEAIKTARRQPRPRRNEREMVPVV